MEVVPALGDSSPFQRRDVAEWTHRDHLTGVLEKARVETDRWAATTANSKHAYGKVVDSRDRSLPDGSAHQRQRQQLEVFQTKGPGGSLQVIRTQTVTSTNSCSSWRGAPSAGPGRSSRPALPAITQDFENLQLTLNPIDLSSEKSKASVGRSGSIGTRRPPSRPRSLVGKPSAAPTTHDTPPSSPVLRICHQTRADQSAKSVKTVDQSTRSARTTRETGSQSPRTTGEIKSGDQSVSTTTNKDGRNVTSSPSSKSSTVTLNGHLSVTRKKSSSIEDLHNGVSEDRDDSDESFKRSSKVRRSLQFPLKKLEARGGVCKLLQELEESSKRTAAEGRIARKSFEALESVLRRNISLTSGSDKEDNDSPGEREEDSIENGSHHAVNSVSIDDFARKFNVSRNKFMLEKRHSYMDTLDKSSQDENEEEKSTVNETKNLFKRHSFVTVESLKEVRGRLKHLNSPLDGLDTESGMEELEDNDDGIGTDDSNKQSGSSVTEVPQLRVKSYVFGLEGVTRPNRLPVLGTGSLESRTSNKASVNGSRSDEWYNRRKSYGFESVHGDESHSRSSALISKFEDKNRLTSTDSGICRSSEQFIFPSWKRKQQEVDTANPSEGEVLQISHSIPLARAIEDRIPTLESNKEDIRKGRTTVVTLGSKAEQSQDPYAKGKELEPLHCNGETERKQGSYLLNKTSNISNSDNNRGSSQSVTVSIPVVQEEPSPSIVSRRLFFQQLSQGTSVSIEKPWSLYSNKGENQMPSLIGSRKIDADDWWRNTQAFGNGNSREEDWKSNKLSNGVLKRHSIAVDNSWKSFNNLNMSVHENLESGSAVVNEPCYRPSQITDNEVKRHSIAVDKFNYLNEDGSRVDSEALVTRKQKRVEFCKTEVHFAAEPGRFNIVETDEKPPPTNMFRRRRRHSTPAPNPDPAKNASNLPVVRFGDSVYEKQLLSGTDDLEERSPDVNGEPMHTPASPIRVREETYVEETFTDVSHSLPAITLDDNDDHCLIESSADPPPRSILKNYKKPKPYLIGENEGSYPDIVEKEEKWGVRLRPICQDQPAAWKPPASLPIRDEVMPTEYSGQSELQKLLRSLRPAQASRGKTSTAAIIPGRREEPRPSDCSVAERVRQVEQQVTAEVKGYSTRVNFGAGEATVVDEYRDMANGHGAYISDDHHKSAWQWREENMVTQGNSGLERLEDSQSRPPQQMSVATAILSSYNDSDRLRAVETLVNTRSGQPKITSISLRYGEDGGEPLRFTSKTAISAERTAPAVSSTRLGPPVSENIHPSLKERKTIFDTGHSNAINSFSQRTSIHSSESPTRTLNVSSFEKKSFGHKRENSPLPKSFMSSRIPNDELIITEVAPEKSVTAKQAIHSELPLKSTSLFDKEVNFKTQQFSASKQVTASCQTVAPKSQRASLMSSKMVSSFERKAPTVSVAGSQSPKPSRVTYPSGESNEKVVPTSHRSSPRSRGTTDSLGSTGSSSVRLDTITATSKTSFTNSAQSHAVRSSKTDGSSKTTFGNMQHTEKKDDAIGPTIALHIQEPSESTLQNVLGKTNRLSNCDSSFLSPTGKNSLVVTESRRVTRSTSRSPTPTKKVTPPSKNSKSKDFIGRVGNDSPIYQNSRKSTSPANGLQRQPSPPPIYQNCEEVSDKYECGLDRMESDSVILAELTRAADEILQAVNGYTDEDSRRGSSDDDCRRLRERRSTPLGTIAEAPSLAKRESSSSHRATVNGSAKRTQRVSSRTKLGPTSSTSSVESFTRETRRVATKSSGSNTSSRAARMVQRANSRELLLQTNASSSEDIASGSETKKRVPPPRRSRTSSSSNKEVTSSSTKSREKTKEGGETSRTRERTSSSRTKTRESSDARETRKKAPEMKHHPIKEKTIPAASGLTGSRSAPRGRHSSTAPGTAPGTTTSSRAKKTSNIQEKTTTGAAKRRTETAVQI